MMRMIGLAVPILLLALGTASAQPAMNELGIEQRLDELVSLDLAFVDERDNAMTLGQYFGGRPVILFLAYYRCPRLCNVALGNLAASLGKLDYQAGKDYHVVVVSIDPRETPAMAAAKKAAILEHRAPPGADLGWHFLTGKETTIQRLAQSVGFRYAYDPQRDLYAHASGITILTPDGKIARYLLGLDYSSRDLRFGLEDASAGKIGSPITQPLRMLCFAYDPSAGKYTLMTMRLVQIAGAITVSLLGIFLVRQWRRERRATPQAEEGGRDVQRSPVIS